MDMKWIPVLPAFLFLALSACAAMPPHDLLVEMTEPTTVAEARERPDSVRGKRVLWGGRIVGTTHEADGVRVEVVGFPLDRAARPMDADRSDGRFLAVVDGFLESEIYRKGREFTVVGTIRGPETGRVGEMEYVYPVVAVEKHHLWEKRPPEVRVVPVYPIYPIHPIHRYHDHRPFRYRSFRLRPFHPNHRGDRPRWRNPHRR